MAGKEPEDAARKGLTEMAMVVEPGLAKLVLQLWGDWLEGGGPAEARWGLG